MKKEEFERVIVSKEYNYDSAGRYANIIYNIDVDDCQITCISQKAAMYIYEQLGNLFKIGEENLNDY